MSPSLPRRHTLSLMAGASLAAGTRAQTPAADAYPSRPIRIIVPFAPGGATDVAARQLAQKMSEKLGQQVVVENKPGAANVLGNDAVAKAPADGYTLLFAAAPIALNSALGMKLPYDVFADFATISLVASIPMLIAAHPATPYKSLADLIQAGKAGSKGLNYATAGVGSSPHLVGEYLRTRYAPALNHIGYKGAAPALQDAVAGTVPVILDSFIPTGAQVLAGKLRGIAVASDKRSAVMPDVPTTAEQGFPDVIASGYYGLLAPARTPAAILARLHAVAVESVNKTDLRDKLIRQGYEVHASTPAEYTAYIRKEIERWTPIVKAAGIKPE